MPVLGTPRLLALAEAATVAAVAPHLADGLTTVGTAVTLEHRQASPVGAEIVVEAELTEVDGRRLVFGFIARRDDGPTRRCGTHADRGTRPPGSRAPACSGQPRMLTWCWAPAPSSGVRGRPGPASWPARTDCAVSGRARRPGGSQTPVVERG